MNIPYRLVAVAFHPINLIGGDNGLDRHLVHGQRPGFIRADHRHRAEGFHGRQLADNRLLPGHGLYAEREDNRDNRR